MLDILLQQIRDLISKWFTDFTTHAQHVENKLDSLDQTASDIKTDADNLPDIKDNTAAVITPINNIKTNTDSIVTSSGTTATNTTAIMNQMSTVSTNTGRAAAYAEDCANNTLNILDKVTTVASDTTQIRADSDSLVSESSKIYDAVKWLLSDKYIYETEEGTSPFSFDTDIVDDLQLLEVGLVATQSGSGDPTPDNVRAIFGYLNAGLTVNGSNITISLGGTTYYGGVLNAVSGTFTVTHRIYMNLGSFNYTYISGNNCFRTTSFTSDYKHTTSGVLSNSMCDSYTTKTLSEVLNVNGPNYSYAFGTSGLYNNSLVIRNNNYTDPTLFKNSLSNVQLIIELETPVTVSLTAQQIAAIKGVNTISTDTNGNIKVTYKESIKHYLDKQDNA